jgi:hypothetical protein
LLAALTPESLALGDAPKPAGRAPLGKGPLDLRVAGPSACAKRPDNSAPLAPTGWVSSLGPVEEAALGAAGAGRGLIGG